MSHSYSLVDFDGLSSYLIGSFFSSPDSKQHQVITSLNSLQP